MDSDIWRLIATPFDIAPSSPNVVVYGAGNTGRSASAYLASAGHRVIAFLDAAARPGQHIDNIPVMRPDDRSSRGDADREGNVAVHTCDVLVAIHNYGVEMTSLQERVGKLGFRRTLNMVHFHNLFPRDQPFRYWLTDRGFYHGREGEIEAAASLLGDETSRRWFNEVLAFRLTGDYSRLPASTPAEQYIPSDLPRWRDPMRFIDCACIVGKIVVGEQRFEGRNERARSVQQTLQGGRQLHGRVRVLDPAAVLRTADRPGRRLAGHGRHGRAGLRLRLGAGGAAAALRRPQGQGGDPWRRPGGADLGLRARQGRL